MNIAAIKLVASDMDGTLLNSQHELNPEFFDLFHQMKTKGILFVAASGRQYFNIMNRFKSIKSLIERLNSRKKLCWHLINVQPQEIFDLR